MSPRMEQGLCPLVLSQIYHLIFAKTEKKTVIGWVREHNSRDGVECRERKREREREQKNIHFFLTQLIVQEQMVKPRRLF